MMESKKKKQNKNHYLLIIKNIIYCHSSEDVDSRVKKKKRIKKSHIILSLLYNDRMGKKNCHNLQRTRVRSYYF